MQGLNSEGESSYLHHKKDSNLGDIDSQTIFPIIEGRREQGEQGKIDDLAGCSLPVESDHKPIVNRVRVGRWSELDRNLAPRCLVPCE